MRRTKSWCTAYTLYLCFLPTFAQAPVPTCVQCLQHEGAAELPDLWRREVSLQSTKHQSHVWRAALRQWLPGGRRGMRLRRGRGQRVCLCISVCVFVCMFLPGLTTHFLCRSVPVPAVMPTTALWKLELNVPMASAAITARYWHENLTVMQIRKTEKSFAPWIIHSSGYFFTIRSTL